MSNRLLLSKALNKVCNNVYFDPPESIKMKYPCIVYSRDTSVLKHANDKVYSYRQGYQVTVIDKNPDSDIPEKLISELSMIDYVRDYVSDNLHHSVFRVFY